MIEPHLQFILFCGLLSLCIIIEDYKRMRISHFNRYYALTIALYLHFILGMPIDIPFAFGFFIALMLFIYKDILGGGDIALAPIALFSPTIAIALVAAIFVRTLQGWIARGAGLKSSKAHSIGGDAMLIWMGMGILIGW